MLSKEFREWYKEKQINRLIENLKKKNYNVVFVKTKEEAKEFVLKTIPKGSTIGLGGSMTVRETGILEAIEKENYIVYNQYKPGLSKEEALELRNKGLTANYYLTGTNAITINGELINLDGFGNRVAAITYGPKKVIIIVGINKIVNSIEEGIKRVREYSAVLNAKRFGAKVPCAETGKCEDCDADERICNSLLITYRQHKKDRVTIVIIDEELGF